MTDNQQTGCKAIGLNTADVQHIGQRIIFEWGLGGKSSLVDETVISRVCTSFAKKDSTFFDQLAGLDSILGDALSVHVLVRMKLIGVDSDSPAAGYLRRSRALEENQGKESIQKIMNKDIRRIDMAQAHQLIADDGSALLAEIVAARSILTIKGLTLPDVRNISLTVPAATVADFQEAGELAVKPEFARELKALVRRHKGPTNKPA